MLSGGILITLPRDSSTFNFLTIQYNTSYKIRLPYSMRSDGNLEVGLIGISMPDLYLSMSSLEAVNEVELGKEKDHYRIPITFFAKDTSILSITNVIIDFC